MKRSDGHMRIGDVVRELQGLYPDVTASSIRFLDREGLIEPQHSGGKQRLFTESDVERLRTIKRWQADRLSLAEIRERLAARVPDDQLPGLARSFHDAMYAGNVADISSMLARLRESGTSLVDIFDVVITPALKMLGNDWHENPAYFDRQLEFDEHFTAFLAAVSGEPVEGELEVNVVAASPEWERHDFALRMIAAVLRERGVPVQVLGAQVPALAVSHAIDRLGGDVVLLSLTREVPADQVRRYVTVIRDASEGEPTIVMGGPVVSDDLGMSGVITAGGGQHIDAVTDQIVAICERRRTGESSRA